MNEENPGYIPLFRAARFIKLTALLIACCGLEAQAQVEVFEVSANGDTGYTFVGFGDNPTLTLERGKIYQFNLDAGVEHPFWISTEPGSDNANAFNDGVTNNGATNGSLTFIVPISAPSTLYYNCHVHSEQGGVINVSNAVTAPYPPVTIQGQLLDNLGTPQVGPVALRVSVLDQPTDGALYYEELFSNLSLGDGGVFDVKLGDGSLFTSDDILATLLDVSGAPYVQLEVNGEPLMPRQLFGSVPYAFRSITSTNVGGLTAFDIEQRIAGTASALDLAEGLILANQASINILQAEVSGVQTSLEETPQLSVGQTWTSTQTFGNDSAVGTVFNRLPFCSNCAFLSWYDEGGGFLGNINEARIRHNGNGEFGGAITASGATINGNLVSNSGNVGGIGLNGGRVTATEFSGVSVNVSESVSAATITASGAISAATVTTSGEISVDQLRIRGGSDIAEPFNFSGGAVIEPGMVVAIDPNTPGRLRLASEPYDRRVAGIVSGAGGVRPGLTLTQEGSAADGENAVALTGRVYAWVDAEANGAIKPGDMLTTSARAGYAMRASDPNRSFGAVLGKAMEPLDSGQGLVLMLVNLQ